MDNKTYHQNKQHLVDVFQETVKTVIEGHYTAPNGIVV